MAWVSFTYLSGTSKKIQSLERNKKDISQNLKSLSHEKVWKLKSLFSNPSHVVNMVALLGLRRSAGCVLPRERVPESKNFAQDLGTKNILFGRATFTVMVKVKNTSNKLK